MERDQEYGGRSQAERQPEENFRSRYALEERPEKALWPFHGMAATDGAAVGGWGDGHGAAMVAEGMGGRSARRATVVVMGVVVVGLDDPLDKRVADDVGSGQAHPAAAGDMLEAPHGVDQAAGPV